MIGRFQPITKGHIKCIEYIYNKYNIPTIICMIETKKTDPKHPFPSDVLVSLYKSMFKDNEMIKDIVLIKNADIVVVGNTLSELGYNIKTWVCGTDRYGQYKRMVDKYSDQAGLDDDFELVEIKRTDEDESATKLREMLKAGDKEGFIKGSPPIFKNDVKNNNFYEKINYYYILKDLI